MQDFTLDKQSKYLDISLNTFQRIVWILRISVACCFIGHGMWGLVSKPGWLPFFGIIGLDEDLSIQAMPFIGAIDIIVGILILFSSNKWLIYWAIFWTFFTALLRPLAAMGFSEFLERAGNFGPPIALLICVNMVNQGANKDSAKLKDGYILIEKVLRFSLFLLLAGHAGLAIIQFQPTLIKNLNFIGYPTDSVGMYLFGAFELVLAALVLFRPGLMGLMFFVLVFKLITESIYPLRGIPYDIFETIERMGDYLIPLCLYLIYKRTDTFNKQAAVK